VSDEPLASFPVRLAVPVAWGEMDAMRHVNNIVYFRWFESARVAYFARIALAGFSEHQGTSAILASTSCRYRALLEYPDTVEVGARVSGFEEHGFQMRYAVWSRNLSRLAAEGEARIVAYDYASRSKVSLPSDLRARIVALEAASGNTLA
jgi:acyl-CoA thioester hydrolase